MAPSARRNKKAVDYSQFGSADDDDDDFADAAIPSSKKSKRVCSGSMKEKTVQQKKPSKEEIQLQKATPNKRVALDHRLYQRDLEVALALSVNESPGSNHEVQDSQGQAEESVSASNLSEDDCGEFIVKKKAIENRGKGRKLNAGAEKHSKSKKNAIAPFGSSTNQLSRVPVKSPTQGLRLGLSRLARVKPLHPNFASTQVHVMALEGCKLKLNTWGEVEDFF
ncbi:RAD51-associated protein 1-like [Rhineura floridana]|uniref:RAD51-associated protein 1-like n=1 Tax=Rhineura floridana TaxID=261503 RepID=UPI002AC82B09|nr:RAD51-associated protein 1-like [Rhineura floridana]